MSEADNEAPILRPSQRRELEAVIERHGDFRAQFTAWERSKVVLHWDEAYGEGDYAQCARIGHRSTGYFFAVGPAHGAFYFQRSPSLVSDAERTELGRELAWDRIVEQFDAWVVEVLTEAHEDEEAVKSEPAAPAPSSPGQSAPQSTARQAGDPPAPSSVPTDYDAMARVLHAFDDVPDNRRLAVFEVRDRTGLEPQRVPAAVASLTMRGWMEHDWNWMHCGLKGPGRQLVGTSSAHLLALDINRWMTVDAPTKSFAPEALPLDFRQDVDLLQLAIKDLENRHAVTLHRSSRGGFAYDLVVVLPGAKLFGAPGGTLSPQVHVTQHFGDNVGGDKVVNTGPGVIATGPDAKVTVSNNSDGPQVGAAPIASSPATSPDKTGPVPTTPLGALADVVAPPHGHPLRGTVWRAILIVLGLVAIAMAVLAIAPQETKTKVWNALTSWAR